MTWLHRAAKRGSVAADLSRSCVHRTGEGAMPFTEFVIVGLAVAARSRMIELD
jgi:hypothetical protein